MREGDWTAALRLLGEVGGWVHDLAVLQWIGDPLQFPCRLHLRCQVPADQVLSLL